MTDEERVAKYRAEASDLRRELALIDERGVRFQESLGSEPWRDVTEQRRARLQQDARMYDELADAWERNFVRR